MYRCEKCGYVGSKPFPVYESDCVVYSGCENCGCTGVSRQEEECSICSRPLYRGDKAYEAGDLLICKRCLTEVTI